MPYTLLYTEKYTNHPLTLTTFLFPFCAPAGIPGTPGTAPAVGVSVAFIPALTVSMRTPVDMAGE